MSQRRYRAGQRFTRDGVHYRIVAGVKGPDDLRLEWRVEGRWLPVSMEHAALHVAVMGDNEVFLYPHGSGYGKLLGFLHIAARYGHQAAVERLRLERCRKYGAAVVDQLRRRGLRELP
jgi:hypothetical protein